MSQKPVSIFTAPSNLPDEEKRARKHMLARLAIAWLAMMQTMMFAFPGYIRTPDHINETGHMLDNAIIIMNWLSFVLTIPVIMYCAWPIWRGVMASSCNRSSLSINMNWPIALGIVVSFIPSAINTWRESGEVYFESVCMFVAFLLTARYLEFCAEQSARFLPNGMPKIFLERKDIIARRSDNIAFFFVLVQIILAVGSAVVWLNIDEYHALPVMVALFVMSCPCALSISVPTAFAAARAVILNDFNMSQERQKEVIEGAERCANQNLYGSLIWHIAMTPLAMIGIVQPWVAAVVMLVSSLLVTFNAWLFYRRYNRFVKTEMVTIN